MIPAHSSRSTFARLVSRATSWSARRRVGIVAASLLLLSGCSVVSGISSTPSTGPAPAIGPYEPVRRAGNLLFLSGQIGTRDDGTVVSGGIGAETKRALERVKALVESEGSTMDRVVKCTVFLVDVAEWDAMNAVYATFFTAGRKPARSAVGGVMLPREARVEIECVATVGT